MPGNSPKSNGLSTTDAHPFASANYARSPGHADWATIPGVYASPMAHLQTPIGKRHRSLTPSLPPSRSSLNFGGQGQPSSWFHQPRFHPYAPIAAGSLPPPELRSLGSQASQRAMSLGPDVLFARQPSDPTWTARNNSASMNEINPSDGHDTAFRDIGQMPYPGTSNANASSSAGAGTANHLGLKDGADGEQISSQRLGQWDEV